MTTQPPPSLPPDSEPAPPPTMPGVALWGDSDPPARPDASAGSPAGVAAPAAGDRSMPTIGHIGRYALKYKLGEGGLGTVYAAHDPLLSRLIAVKTLNVQVAADERESFNARFINEARAAGGLSHPHIVTVFDAGISDDHGYIAMELLKGRDLRQLRQEGWRATPAQAALIVRRVADALAFAHSKGVIHRDVKPANIFMVGRTQPRVLDFGIARIAHEKDRADPLPGAGSPHYMAPEQVKKETADRRADVFSLGVVLYELLTDTKPFRGETLKEIRDAVLMHEPPLAHKVDPSVPKELAQIAARAMAKDPDHRFRSARSFARELRQWLDAHAAAGDGEIVMKPAPAAKRPPWLVVGAVGALVAVAGVAGWFATAPSLDERVASATAAAAAAAAGDKTAAVDKTAAAAGVVVKAPTAVDIEQASAPAATAAATTQTAAAVAMPTTSSTTASALRSPTTSGAATASSAELPTAASGTTAMQPSRDGTVAVGAPTTTSSTVDAPVPPSSRPGPSASRGSQAAADDTSATAKASASPSPKPAATATAALPLASAKPNAAGAAAPRETAKERRAREAREKEARDNEARVAAAAKLVAPPTGTVRIAISPWGQVEVDGAPSGAAPPLTELRLPEGRHQIVVRNGDFAPFSTSVDVAPGQTVTLRHKFGS